MIGGCLIKHWSKTQSTISLSSGEAELHGIAYGAAQALGLQSLLKDLGWSMKIRVHSDATAAIGICRRKGLGKVRHLATTDLWIQDKVRSRTIELCKILGTENPADLFTKILTRQPFEKHRKTVLNLAGDTGMEHARRERLLARNASSQRDGTGGT